MRKEDVKPNDLIHFITEQICTNKKIQFKSEKDDYRVS